MKELTSHIIPQESRTIAELVKKHIQLADASASVILFGSRARGDAEEDSDWDFLVLTQEVNTDLLSEEIRKFVHKEVELQHCAAISLIIKNAIMWESDYAVTNIYESITEEGILL